MDEDKTKDAVRDQPRPSDPEPRRKSLAEIDADSPHAIPLHPPQGDGS